MEYAAIVTSLALLLYLYVFASVGWARGKYKVDAPATTGDPIFERYFRVQQNTVEQLIVFLPALWLCAYYVGGIPAAALGGVFLIGRLLYMRGYIREPGKRGIGFLIGFLANVALVISGLVGAVRAAL